MPRSVLSAYFAAAGIFLAATAAYAAGPEFAYCTYIEAGSNAMRKVAGPGEIPPASLATAQCYLKGGNGALAAPQEIELKGAVRSDTIASGVGPVKLKWPRKVEQLFGRTPQRAVSEAARTLARVVRSSGFPIALQNLNLPWEIVFLDEELPATQIPTYLISNCHPAWMTPPANLYIVSQRVAAGCGGQRRAQEVADSELIQVLLHEMGHAVEHFILRGEGSSDRMRAEGFASWFEAFASDRSSLVTRGAAKARYVIQARESFRQSPGAFDFRGTPADYGRASLYFHAIVERRGVGGLMSVYQLIAARKGNFYQAVAHALNWDGQRLESEAREQLR